MAKNHVFFAQAALDRWIEEGKVELAGDELTIKAGARRYRIVEAVHVLKECTGSPDANELLGKVKTRLYLGELGAELLETSMVLGDNAYDVSPGFLGSPVGTFQEHLAGGARPEAKKARPEAEGSKAKPLVSDEDLLARYLLESF